MQQPRISLLLLEFAFLGSAVAELPLPAKCADIQTPLVDFVGGKASGVSIGSYSNTLNIQFIGCRGDETGAKTAFTNTSTFFNPISGQDETFFTQSCDPASFFCEDSQEDFFGIRESRIRFGTTVAPPFSPPTPTGRSLAQAFQQAR